jgi:hypothetical protein
MSKIIKNPGASDAITVAENLGDLTAGVARATARAAYEVGHILLNNAISVTPMDTGDLRDSGYVTWKGGGGSIEVEVGFGGAAAPYALAVHELEGSINWSEPGTGAKYLERPFDGMKGKFSQMIADRVADMLAANSAPRSPGKK